MTLLQVFGTGPAASASPNLSSSDPAAIAATLAPMGIGFERWQVHGGGPQAEQSRQVVGGTNKVVSSPRWGNLSR